MKKALLSGLCLMAAALLQAQSVSITWELVKNDVEPGVVESRLTIANHTGETLTADGGWLIGYCWMSVHPYSFEGAELEETEVCASYHILCPTADFKPLPTGEERTYKLLQKGAIIRESCGPQGGFFVKNESATPVDAPITSLRFTDPSQWMRKGGTGYADGEWLYDYNNLGTMVDMKHAEAACRPLRLVPQPKVVVPSKKAAKLLTTPKAIKNTELPEEGYRITFGKDTTYIEYADKNGLFFAEQTIHRLAENGEKVYVEKIEDWPDLHHRGLMLDISRNYTSKAEILKLLDAMAAYKMNVFHFHIADDEAWRLEIPGLPELTEVGSRRGYTTDEHDMLYPAYNGGWDPTAPTTANGYLTREDYIHIVRYAHERCIRVIPEIDMPGHSRAAIVSMEERYRRLKDTDLAAAEEYRLIDPDDKSVYSSAQHYNDDVICIARPSCYTFANKVIDEIANMHEEAGQPLTVFHVGGDEVADGAFEGSPLCKQKMAELGFSHTYELKDWFLRQLIDHLRPMGVQIAGWEEIAMRGGEANPAFADDNVLSWCWNSIPEWRGDEKPYKLANAGYPVILACVGNNYIDMSYTNHQSERGLNWGGYTDERSTFDFLPFDIYRSVRYTLKRERRDIDQYDREKTLRLAPSKRANIIGTNGQLFAETIRSDEQTEQYIFPKLQGLAERGWNATPISTRNLELNVAALKDEIKNLKDKDYFEPTMAQDRSNAWLEQNKDNLNTAWNFEIERIVYFYQLYRHELPRLKKMGIRFHLAQPGISVGENKKGKQMVYMNCPIPDAVIRYTTDGSEPTDQSPVYKKPILLPANAVWNVRAKAFYLGEESNTTFLDCVILGE